MTSPKRLKSPAIDLALTDPWGEIAAREDIAAI